MKADADHTVVMRLKDTHTVKNLTNVVNAATQQNLSVTDSVHQSHAALKVTKSASSGTQQLTVHNTITLHQLKDALNTVAHHLKYGVTIKKYQAVQTNAAPLMAISYVDQETADQTAVMSQNVLSVTSVSEKLNAVLQEPSQVLTLQILEVTSLLLLLTSTMMGKMNTTAAHQVTTTSILVTTLH
jgi:hypothetical protein